MQEILKQYEKKFGVVMPIVSGLTQQECEILQKSMDENKPLTVDELTDALDYDEDKIY